MNVNGVVLARFLEPMAIERRRGRAMIQSLLFPAQIEAAKEVQAAMGSSVEDGGVTAVIPLYGFIDQRPSMEMMFFGGVALTRVATLFRGALRDPAVKAIVFDVASPGGVVYGVPEFADEIMAARGQKPIVAVADSLAASAAYWIASAADELVVTPSGEVGSVGVYSMHEDISEMAKQMGVHIEFVSAGKGKTDGNPFEPLSDDARQDMQTRVNDYYGMFVSSVSRGRGVAASLIRDTWGARVVGAKEAVELKMADRVATLQETLTRLSSGPGRAAAMRKKAEAEPPPVLAEPPIHMTTDVCLEPEIEVVDQTKFDEAMAEIDLRRRRAAAR